MDDRIPLVMDGYCRGCGNYLFMMWLGFKRGEKVVLQGGSPPPGIACSHCGTDTPESWVYRHLIVPAIAYRCMACGVRIFTEENRKHVRFHYDEKGKLMPHPCGVSAKNLPDIIPE